MQHLSRGCLAWLVAMGTVITLAIVGYGVYLERAYLPIVGYIWLTAIGLLPIAAIAIGVLLAIKYTLQIDWHDIGEYGAIGQRFHRLIEIQPYTPRIASPAATAATDQAINIDTLGDVIEKALIGVASERFLFGYFPDNTPCYGVWDRVKSLIVAGISGSGKSVTIVFILVQLMLSKAARLTVIDPHWSKADGLSNRLKPLSAYGTFIRGNDNNRIVEAIAAFRTMLERRISGEAFNHAEILVIDEWNRIASRSKEIFDDVKWIVEEIAQEGRGYQVYVLLAGQIWMPSKAGGSSIVDSMQAVYVHRLKKTQSRFLVDAEIAKQTEKLSPGHVFFSDANGEVERLVIPEAKYRDAVTVRDMLREATPLPSPHDATGRLEYTSQQLLAYQVPSSPETNGFNHSDTHAETTGFTVPATPLQLSSPSETSRFSTLEAKTQEVAKLRGLGFKQSDILYRLWNVKPGATKEYQDARLEYQRIIERLVRSA